MVFFGVAACAVVSVVGWVAGQLIRVVIEALNFGE
jgi:hypothetical protein